MSDNRTKTRAIVFELLESIAPGPFEHTEEASLIGDVGLESVELMELLDKIERRFNIEIDDAALDTIETVGELVDSVLLRT